MKYVPSARSWFTGAGAVLFVCLSAAPVMAQTPTLAELAKQEQERRKAVQAAGRVITNKDLPKSSPAAAVPPPAAPQPETRATPPSGAKEPASKDEVEKDEAWWRERMTQARESLRRDQLFAEALQSRINALTTEFVNRDDPYQRARIGEERQQAVAELERVRAAIESTTRKIADIEEEARQAGVAPGWIR